MKRNNEEIKRQKDILYAIQAVFNAHPDSDIDLQMQTNKKGEKKIGLTPKIPTKK